VKQNPPLRCFFGHHKCATTWISDILRLVCRDLDREFVSVHSPALFDYRLDTWVEGNGIDFLAYTNADIRYVERLEGFRGFHVIRDPRDIVVSAYFSHLHSHPTDEWKELVDHRKRLQQVSKDEGLFLEMDFRRREFEHLYNWDYGRPSVLELKMENLIAAPYEEMARVFAFLGVVRRPPALAVNTLYLLNASRRPVELKDRLVGTCLQLTRRLAAREKRCPAGKRKPTLSARALLEHVFNNRFASKTSGRRRGQENASSHYRKGMAGDWANHFTSEHRQYFKERYNNVLIRLGYAESPDW